MKQSNNLTMEKCPFHLPHWAVILLLLFVPPIAWWHMWKNHRYHTWFPYVLWLNAAITFGFATYVIVNFYPLLTRFVDSKTFIFTSHIGLLLLAVFEIIFGFYLIKMFKNETMLKRKILAIVIVLLFINTIAIPISQLFITSTIQSRFEKNPAVTSTNQKEASTVHPDEIGANWKTYTSQDKAFSFKYPSDLVYTETKNYEYLFHSRDTDDIFGINIEFGHPITDKEKKFYYQNPPKVITDFEVFFTPEDKKNSTINLREFATTMDDGIESTNNLMIDNKISATEYIWGCQSSCVNIVFNKDNALFNFSITNFSDEQLTTLRKVIATIKFY